MRVAAGLLIVMLSAPARADSSSIDVAGHLGLAAPYGLVGAAAGISSRRLTIDAGVGRGLAGTQVGVMPRLRLGSHPRASLTVSAGVSAGDYRTGPIVCFDEDPCGEKDIFSVWINADTGIEYRGESGLLLRAFVGVGVIANRNHFRQELGDNHPNVAERTLSLPYVGGSVGFALPL